MYACSAIHLGLMPRFVFKFIRISVDGENIENDMKTIVWTENILSVFGAKTPFSNLSGLVCTAPLCLQFTVNYRSVLSSIFYYSEYFNDQVYKTSGSRPFYSCLVSDLAFEW